MNKRAIVLLSTAMAGTLLLSACGGAAEDDPAPAAESKQSARHNKADVEFAQMMIPHHEQAVEMAELAETRAGADVRSLAKEIDKAQGPEIKQLTGMLESWGEEPLESMDHSMDGMLTDAQMTELEQADGDAFDKAFVDSMIEHHEGAVDMAQSELDDGENPEAKKLAEDIVSTQNDEITRMRELLGESPTDDGGSGEGSGDSGDGSGEGSGDSGDGSDDGSGDSGDGSDGGSGHGGH
ncbi:uncharacterized protein (DUF305 family) [Murinocardiopsis flavida]|uniref:Uncharacterized protein (DUF305 family) n=1 Tax=Murinocardiopsis flavida TaxID=645275 RepID=A0A2P8DFK9_9ACTN|nr:DUF305 domain-containing protein [Murinocardiopsis flavida]PSK95996.1 uncharacterized protein (DUF305 family) [Murinocardiopsis flavida]